MILQALSTGGASVLVMSQVSHFEKENTVVTDLIVMKTLRNLRADLC